MNYPEVSLFRRAITFLRDLPVLVLFGLFIVCLYLGWVILPLAAYFWLGHWWAAVAGLVAWWTTVSAAHAFGYFET